jgi:hypothetical protein
MDTVQEQARPEDQTLRANISISCKIVFFLMIVVRSVNCDIQLTNHELLFIKLLIDLLRNADDIVFLRLRI